MTATPRVQASATVSSKGQIVIPSAIRLRLNLVQGSVVRFVVEGDGVRLLPEAGDVRRLKGRLTPPPKPVSIAAMNEAVSMRRAGAAAAADLPRRRRDRA